MSILRTPGLNAGLRVSVVLFASVGLALLFGWGLIWEHTTDARAQEVGTAPYLPADDGAKERACLAQVGGVTYPAVQQAVDAAGLGDTVRIAEGICYENVAITKVVTLEGGWDTGFATRGAHPASLTTIDGLGLGRVISITGVGGGIGPVLLDGLTLTGGDATGLGNGLSGPQGTYDTGGGVYSYRADTTIWDCVVRGNTASTTGIGWGGGIGYIQSAITVRHSVVADNVASTVSNGYGGGIYGRHGTATILGSTVADNVATEGAGGLGLGGGMQVHFGDAALADNDVRRNTASLNGTGYGGGFSVYATSLVKVYSTEFADNHAAGPGQAGYGGGLSAREPGFVAISDATIMGNRAEYGGGVYVDNMETAVSNSRLMSNTAEWGGGLYAVGDAGPSLTVTMASNDLLGNVAETPSAGSGGRGGGLAFIFANVDLVGNEIAENRTDGAGGGVQMEQVNATFRDTVVRDNRAVGTGAGSGGGLHLISTSAAMTNTVLIDNRVSYGGAGMAAIGAYARMVHTTVARNRGGDESGIYLALMHPGGPASVLMTDSIVVDHGVGITATAGTMGMTNTATLDGVLWYGNGANTGGGGVIQVSNATTGDPAFTPDGYHLTPFSAAIDQGVGSGGVADVDGDPRPIGPAVDLGADEAPRWLFLPLVMRGA